MRLFNTCNTPLSKADVCIVDEKNIDHFPLPESTKNYFSALVKRGLSPYIDNITADFRLLQVDNSIIPLVIATDNYNDSYVCSEYGHYILLALESLFIIENRVLRKLAEWFIKPIGAIIRRGNINNVIYVNHSLFSTDLQNDDLTIDQITSITSHLQANYPKHAIIFRGINSVCCPKLRKKLADCGYKFIASRQIHVTDPRNPDLYNTRIIKSDMRLWENHTYTVVDKTQLTKEDELAVLDLYNKLAIENHSKLNPRLKPEYLNLIKKYPGFSIKALKKNGKVEGAFGFVCQKNALTCLLFGYDKKGPDATQLYRIMSTILLLEAKKNGDVFHQSSGATFYKTIRRAKSITEYQGVYNSHLPFMQRAAWFILRSVMNTIAIPLMKKY